MSTASAMPKETRG